MKRRFLDFVGMAMPGLVSNDFFRLFREHPALYVPEAESHYFSSENITKGRDWYEAHFADCEEGQKRGEVSTSYLFTPGVAARLVREYPDTKLFALLPDPLEAVATLYDQTRQVPGGRPTPGSLEDFIEQHPKVLEQFRFGRHLAGFFSYYSPVDFVVCTYEDIRVAPAAEIKKIYELLEVDTKFIPKQLVATVDTDADMERPSRLAKLLRLDKLRAKRRAEKRAFVKTLFTPPAVTMTAREQVLLTRYFEDDVAQLSALLHRNLASEWHHVRDEKSKKK